ncbi:hypothetical protein QJS04_geneDACA011376 [Acorus gramineus]|uniref:Uncharacterized protein n=1 Tax=Acorus gramineus TaxID=55184 RepID=A0AAV9AKD0_ACOGR|nr:hypothetical protein QJS04_geneDACA011376 [Acorus gramineus]
MAKLLMDLLQSSVINRNKSLLRLTPLTAAPATVDAVCVPWPIMSRGDGSSVGT